MFGDSCCTKTTYRIGTQIGSTETTLFLIPGRGEMVGYTENFLVGHWVDEGSNIILTELAFMTT